MRGWDFLFFRPGIFEPNQQKSPDWNRGGYLVEGPAHCGSCHTPKNMFGADKRGRPYGGGLAQGRFPPPLATAPRRLPKPHPPHTLPQYLPPPPTPTPHP